MELLEENLFSSPASTTMGTIRPVPTYPPNFVRESSDFHRAQIVNANAQRVTNLPTHEPEGVYPQTSFIPEELP